MLTPLKDHLGLKLSAILIFIEDTFGVPIQNAQILFMVGHLTDAYSFILYFSFFKT